MHPWNKVNEVADDNLIVQPASKSTVHRQRIKCREKHLEEMDNKLAEAQGPIQLMFDGKKINERERMVVVVQYVNENRER